MSVRAITDIERGEEILVSYNYNIGQAPDWYRHAWFSHLRDNKEWSEEKIQVTLYPLTSTLCRDYFIFSLYL